MTHPVDPFDKAYAERGQIPAMRIGNRWMFLRSLLDEWRRKKLMGNYWR
jgi:hypothetical protein